MKQFLKQYGLFVCILIGAFIIRLVAAYVQSFSNDELSALYRLQFTQMHELIHWGIKVDGHPAFVQLFLYGYTKLVPQTELWIRLPFVIASTIGLIFIFLSVKKLAGEFSAYIIAIMMAFAGFSIQLGYFARPYAFGILFSAAATYYWILVFIESNRKLKYYIGFIVCSILAAYTHYFALLQILVLGMSTFVFSNWRQWWRILLGGLVIFLAFLPHYPITAFQLSVGGIGGWLGKPKPHFLLDLLFTYFDYSWLILAVLGLILLFVLITSPQQPELRKFGILLFFSVVPFIILYQYSIRINAVLQLSACYFFMPYALSSLLLVFEPVPGKRWNKWLPVPLMVVFLISAIFLNSAFKPIHFAEFKKVAAYIQANENDSVTTIVAVNNPTYFDFYLNDKHPDLYITDMGDNISFLKRMLDTCNTNEIIYAFANQRSNPEIPYIIQSELGGIVQVNEFKNSGYYHYKRHSSTNGRLLLDGKQFLFNRNQQGFDLVPSEHKDSYNSYVLNTDKEFGPTFKIKLSDYQLKTTNRIISQVQFMNDSLCDLELVVSVENDRGVSLWKSRKLFQQMGMVQLNQFEKDSGAVNTGLLNTGLIIAENLDVEGIDFNNDYLKIYVWNPNHCSCLITYHSIWFVEGNKWAD